MMNKNNALLAILLATLLAFVSAQDMPFYFTSPLNGTVWKAGSTGKITWINGLDQSVEIKVLQGNDPLTMQPTGYSIQVSDGTTGWYDWTVPSDLSPDQSYSLQLIYLDNTGSTTLYSYSGAFSITGGSGSASSSAITASSPAVVTPSASAISSGSSAASSASPVTNSRNLTTGSLSLSASASLSSQSSETTNVAAIAFNSNAFAVAIPLFILGAVMA